MAGRRRGGAIHRGVLLGGGLLALAAAGVPAVSGERFITVASTTSTRDSGLFDQLLPKFTARTGIEVRVVAVGTGQAIRLAQQGDADVLLVHDREAELKFVEEGYGVDRRDVMYNDFVIAGPRSDPAGITGMKDAAAAFERIAARGSTFVSRGDESGTHRAELRLWRAAGVEPEGGTGAWYLETGSGMGAVLNTAAAIDGYTLADRGTWLGFKNRRTLRLLVEGDPRLFNQYGVALVNPARFPHVKEEEGRAFLDWLTSPEGQGAIAEFAIDGEPLFFPNTPGPVP